MTSILVSLFIVIIASLNLVLDFDFIGSFENGAPKIWKGLGFWAYSYSFGYILKY
ncbi:MAG: hypothetical protein CM15mP22_0850 [Gammaproteobacteria bacterium]|nr:MAG: hypothetical protein CM15mP22_0850 [Gammaproteobacteria bacterium]